jgi:phenylalanyl-tRNA synthetase beta chain
MTISYKWLAEYLPEEIEPQELSKILTSIGLEVEISDSLKALRRFTRYSRRRGLRKWPAS